MPGVDPGAQSSLADAYYEGAGVEPDLEQAARWYRAAANGGDDDASVMLGMMYADCDVDMDDDPDAERWLRVAADTGHDPARYLLGELGVAGYPTIDDDETPGSYRAAPEQDTELARARTHTAAPKVMATGLGATPEEVRAMIDKARQPAWRGEIRSHSTSSRWPTTRGWGCRRTMPRRSGGSGRRPDRAIRSARTTSA